ncbi:uncharacterized protein SPSK_00597 [Sporothrix schenckii 1099-18]|uniref:Uncharacterized protein n=1 Tax=Sporothrix schenckii 1099-18 TaxID=1397361 RepID=A0A0F2LTR4_SPOSC|nr:uncharacterized protein SPSK_00597 [Sporothrix schenckii 1099-18]KJR79910.1 hypothetical protein SPSK_00597 [Sporothrix schenckii 1099-18]
MSGRSLIGQLVPLVVLFMVIGGLAFVGYQIYLSVNKIQAQATKNIGNKNITFTKDGMRVNVKEVKNEKYVDATQKVFVDVWNQHANNIGLDEQRKRLRDDVSSSTARPWGYHPACDLPPLTRHISRCTDTCKRATTASCAI